MYIILALHTVKIIIISVIYHILVYQKICRNDHMQRALVSQDIIQNISQMTYLSLFHSYISLSRQSRYPNSTTIVQYTKYLAIYSCQVLCSMHTHTSSSFKIQRTNNVYIIILTNCATIQKSQFYYNIMVSTLVPD